MLQSNTEEERFMRLQISLPVSEAISSCKRIKDSTSLLLNCFDEAGFKVECLDIATREKVKLMDLPLSPLGYTDCVYLSGCILVVNQLDGEIMIFKNSQRVQGNIRVFCKVGMHLMGKSLQVYKNKLYFLSRDSTEKLCELRIFEDRYHVRVCEFPGAKMSHISVFNGYLFWAGKMRRRECLGKINLITMKIVRVLPFQKATAKPTSLDCQEGIVVLSNHEVHNIKSEQTIDFRPEPERTCL